MKTMLDYALAYIKLGWYIFPLCPGQKVPITKHGVKDATTDEALIRKWWEKWPDANIGLACGKVSGVYVVDIDRSETGDVNGFDSLKEFPELPHTISQSTPRGGCHVFYWTNNPPANRNSFRPGIDIRGDGYYVVLAPSIHPNGGVYEWIFPPWNDSPAEFPDFMRPTTRSPWNPKGETRTFIVLDELSSVPVAAANVDVLSRARLYLTQCDAAIQGQAGHSKLLWAAVAMVRGFLLPDDQALTLLEREYNPRCVPPWDLSIPKEAKDFRRKVGEAHKVTPDKPDGWLLEGDAYKSIDSSQVMTQAEVLALIKHEEAKKFTGNLDVLGSLSSAPADGIDIMRPPGLVGDICDWINDTAMRRQPFLSLACTLAFCGVLFGRKVKDHIGTRTNIYTLGIANSSAGKNHAQNQIRNICDKAGCLDLLGGVNVTGDAAIESKLSASPSTLFLWDEIGFLLSYVKSGLSKHHAGLIPFLMQLYSSSGSVFLGREYADEEKQRKIIQPCCCIYGVSSPERFMPGLTPEQVIDGWLARCMVFRAEEMPKKERKDCVAYPPDEIVEMVRKWHDRIIIEGNQGNLVPLISFDKTGEGSAASPTQIEVPNTDNSEDVFVQFDNFCEKKGKASEYFCSLWLKGEENARKIALIVASGVDFDRPKITTPIAKYACSLVSYLLEDFCRVTAPKISSCQLDTYKQKILEIIDGEGIEGCLPRTITRFARWSSKKQRESIMSDLVEAGEACVAPTARSVRYWTAENYLKYIARESSAK